MHTSSFSLLARLVPESLPPIQRWGRRLLALAVGLLALAGQTLQAQYIFNVHLHGLAYQRNATGNLIPVAINNGTLLKEAAAYVGLSSTNDLALVYHIQGSDYGDTIDAINRRTGATYMTVIGLFFGEDPSLRRMAITNSAASEVRRIDYVYTRQNSHSMGTGFATKRFITDQHGNLRASIDAKLQWIVLPDGLTDTRICTATFTTTTLWKPVPAAAAHRRP